MRITSILSLINKVLSLFRQFGSNAIIRIFDAYLSVKLLCRIVSVYTMSRVGLSAQVPRICLIGLILLDKGSQSHILLFGFYDNLNVSTSQFRGELLRTKIFPCGAIGCFLT